MQILKQLFKPRYQHPDPVQRLKAIKRLNDVDLLRAITKKDDDEHVRKAAAVRMYQVKKERRR